MGVVPDVEPSASPISGNEAMAAVLVRNLRQWLQFVLSCMFCTFCFIILYNDLVRILSKETIYKRKDKKRISHSWFIN